DRRETCAPLGGRAHPNRNPRPPTGPTRPRGRRAAFPGPPRRPDTGVGKPDGPTTCAHLTATARAGGSPTPPFPPRGPALPGRTAMTLAEYLDPARFPLTTEPGLSPRQQLLAD